MTGLLTRKINQGKWAASEALASDEIAADAVTSDLRTTGNALSFWKCASNDVVALNETVLAVASAYDRLDRVDIAWVAKEEVVGAGLLVKESPENAHVAVESLKEQHADIISLDVVRLGKVAELIRSAVKRSHVKRFDKQQVLKVIVAAVKSERLSTGKLKEKLRDAVEKELQKGQGARPADQGSSKEGHSKSNRPEGGARGAQESELGTGASPGQRPAAPATSKRSRVVAMVKRFFGWLSRE